jgi:hypothetical protein
MERLAKPDHFLECSIGVAAIRVALEAARLIGRHDSRLLTEGQEPTIVRQQLAGPTGSGPFVHSVGEIQGDVPGEQLEGLGLVRARTSGELHDPTIIIACETIK